MEVRDLRYFAVAAELSHLHRAAKQVGRSQPALSKCIRRLEDELGADLFKREGRTIRLTQVGSALLLHARRVVQNLDDALREVTATIRGDIGHVRVGSGPTAAEWLLPGVFNGLTTTTPGLTFEVVTGLSNMLRELLREGKLDLVIGPAMDTDAGEFSVVPLGEDVMVVAARIDHPLARQQHVSLKNLLDYKWILPAPSMSSTAAIKRAFAAQGLVQPMVQIEVNTVLPLRRVIAETDLLTLLSRRDLNGGGRLTLSEIKVRELALHREFSVLFSMDHYVSPATQRLIEHLRKHGKTLFGGTACSET